MARFNVTGLEAVIRDMHRMDQQTGRVADEMLMAAASVVTEAWKNAIEAHGHYGKYTGDMYESVGPTRPATKGDVRTLTVYPQGKDRTGTRNVEKAFIANFGREHQDGTGFANEAENAAEAPAQTAMVAVWDAFIGD